MSFLLLPFLALAQSPTPASALRLPPGFAAELLLTAMPEQGSWINLAFGPDGAPVLSPEIDRTGVIRPLLRVTPPAPGRPATVVPISGQVGGAMGLAWAHGSLYVCGVGPGPAGAPVFGVFRLTDADNDGTYERGEMLRELPGGFGEHGAHALATGPDGLLYLLMGNMTRALPGLATNSPARHFADDTLPRPPPQGRGRTPPPAGHVLRFTPDGARWELFASGLRNAYDFAFSADGELFTADSDTEADVGLPWYRPNRVLHLVSGSDHGFREGAGVFAPWHEDALPATADLGLGSPSGVAFERAGAFPPPWRGAFFVADWALGRILATPLRPVGGSYAGRTETFLSGPALAVTDLAFGPDGALYFITGGRGTLSALYRVTATNGVAEAVVPNAPSEPRALRRRLETLHTRVLPNAATNLWPHLGSADRFTRHAARTALEAQPAATWQARALTETNASTALPALLALARVTAASNSPPLFESLARFPLAALSEPLRLQKLRALHIALARHTRPAPLQTSQLVAELLAALPSASPAARRDTLALLVHLDPAAALRPVLAHAGVARTQEELVFPLSLLPAVTNGWTADDYKAAFTLLHRAAAPGRTNALPPEWFASIGRAYADGPAYARTLDGIRRDLFARLSDAERAAIAPFLTGQQQAAVPAIAPASRAFVRAWKIADFTNALAKTPIAPSAARGKALFTEAQCAACHRLDGEGAAHGPDLTGAGARFNARDLLEAILDPSKTISDQWQNQTLTHADGTEVTGRVVSEAGGQITLLLNPLTGDTATLPAATVKTRAPARLSPMPTGMLDGYTEAEVLELLGHLARTVK